MKSYDEIFNELKQFKAEQNRQKQRGLNNYNILTTVLSPSDEVRLHSRMIHSLLDPNGDHYQDRLFLDKFLEVLQLQDFDIDTNRSVVYREYNNIDLYITDGNKHIIIENKVHAGDQKNQIKRYIEVIKKEDKESEYDDIFVIYLSLNRQEPSQYSLGDLSLDSNIIKQNSTNIAQFKSIHYPVEILKWLELCQYEVQNITNLNQAIIQYRDVVLMLSNQYKEKIMQLSDYIQQDEFVYDMAIELPKALSQARKEIIEEFFENVKIQLQDKLNNQWEIELTKDILSKYHGFPFKIYKQNWIKNSNNHMIFNFAFERSDYRGGYFGVTRSNETVEIKNDIKIQFEHILDMLDLDFNTTDWYLHWEWVYMNSHTDFAKYVKFNENAQAKFIERILYLIKIFETDSQLMSKMNNYLNEKNS